MLQADTEINQEAQVFSHPGKNRFLERNMIRKIKKEDISEKSDLSSHFRKDKKKKIHLQSSTDDFKLRVLLLVSTLVPSQAPRGEAYFKFKM